MNEKINTPLMELIKEMESLIDKPYINPKNALNDCIHLAYAKLPSEKEYFDNESFQKGFKKGLSIDKIELGKSDTDGMFNNLSKAIENAYRQGLKDADGVKDISPFLITSQVKAFEITEQYFNETFNQ